MPSRALHRREIRLFVFINIELSPCHCRLSSQCFAADATVANINLTLRHHEQGGAAYILIPRTVFQSTSNRHMKLLFHSSSRSIRNAWFWLRFASDSVKKITVLLLFPDRVGYGSTPYIWEIIYLNEFNLTSKIKHNCCASISLKPEGAFQTR